MPRDLPIGNGSLLVNFDQTYQVRDLYWPHVGQENHTLGHTFRVGIWVEGQFRWLGDPAWERDLRFDQDALLTRARLHHSGLGLSLEFADTVDFHEGVLIRRCSLTDETQRERNIRVFFHHDFHILGSEVGDTAYYEPEHRAIFTTSSASTPTSRPTTGSWRRRARSDWHLRHRRRLFRFVSDAGSPKPGQTSGRCLRRFVSCVLPVQERLPSLAPQLCVAMCGAGQY